MSATCLVTAVTVNGNNLHCVGDGGFCANGVCNISITVQGNLTVGQVFVDQFTITNGLNFPSYVQGFGDSFAFLAVVGVLVALSAIRRVFFS